MDAPRYFAYRDVQRKLAGAGLDEHERERLRDIGEGLLLTRDPYSEEADSLRSDAALALSMLVGQKRLSDVEADVLWRTIADCGPRALSRAG
jgi:hypothetical protein